MGLRDKMYMGTRKGPEQKEKSRLNMESRLDMADRGNLGSRPDVEGSRLAEESNGEAR